MLRCRMRTTCIEKERFSKVGPNSGAERRLHTIVHIRTVFVAMPYSPKRSAKRGNLEQVVGVPQEGARCGLDIREL